MPTAPAEQFGMSQMVPTRAVRCGTVTSPPSEERCSLAPHPGCGSGTVEHALRLWANTHLTHFEVLQKERRVCDPLKESYQNKQRPFIYIL